MRRRSIFTATLVAVAAVLSALPANAAGPEVSSLLPAGAQRGTATPVTFQGKFPTWPAQGWADAPGITFTAGEEKGTFSITIAADAAPGLHWLRLHDAAGASAPIPFVVGTLAEIVENEPNDAPSQAEAAPSPTCVVNGRLGKSGDVDHFAVNLTKGQTLVASLAAHETLGSPIDAVLHVVSPGGFQLAYNHDQRGLDPEIVFTAPADGRYVVRVFGFPSTPNSTIGFAGSDACVYRLTLTTGAFVDYSWPLAVTRSRDATVELAGWNIPDSLRAMPVKPDGETLTLTDQQLANTATLLVEPHETLIETEPNDRAAPQAIALPVTITGRIDGPRDVDVFRFEGKQGETLVFELGSRGPGYPLDGVLEITDDAGKRLALVDDSGAERDPRATFSPPSNGPYRVVVSDLNRQGSPRHVYRLRAVRTEPSFQVTLDAPAYTVSPDKPAEIALAIDRQNGFAEEIAFTVTGLPSFVTAAPATSAATGDSAKTVKLALSSTGGEFSGPIRIVATGTGASKLARTATTAIPNHTARIADVWLTATPKK